MRRGNVTSILILLVILAIAVWGFFAAAPNIVLQLGIGVATALSYVVWGILHHAGQGDLHPKIVVEYILIGAISIVLLITVLGF